jgi:tRNA(Phe) wybutosine-synthesizing methylase Tyw3
MQEIENAIIVGHSTGERNIIIVKNEATGKIVKMENPKGLEIELGMEGFIMFTEEPVMQLISFEPTMVEELA